MVRSGSNLQPTRAMILAAGRGERLRPMSDKLPKALMPVDGRGLIEHLLLDLARAGVEEVVINLAWLGAMVQDKLGNGSKYGVEIRYSDEGDQALETGGGIRKALPLLGEEPFWVVNADVRTDFPFVAANFRPGDLAWLMMAPNPAHKPHGDFGLEEGRVSTTPRRWTFSGISVLSPALFEGVKEERFRLAPLLRAAADKGRVSGALHEGYWADAGTAERLEAVRRREA